MNVQQGAQPEPEPDPGERVTARRKGPGQVFVLSVLGDDRRWCVRQWAAKPRKGRGEFAPWWYEDGCTWHLYNGEAPQATPEGELRPPLASFGTIDQAKTYVAGLVPQQPSAG